MTISDEQSRDVVTKLNLISTMHHIGLGDDWLKRAASEAADTIVSLRKELQEAIADERETHADMLKVMDREKEVRSQLSRANEIIADRRGFELQLGH